MILQKQEFGLAVLESEIHTLASYLKVWCLSLGARESNALKWVS